jgi:hypothetical protein
VQLVDDAGMPLGPFHPDCGPLDEDCSVGGLVRLRAGARPVTLFLSRRSLWLQDIAFDGLDFFLDVLADASPGAVLKISGRGGPAVYLEEGGGFALDDQCLYWGDATGIFSVAKDALPPALPTPAGSSHSCRMGDAGTAACDIGLECAMPEAGPIGCTVCDQPDGQAVDCRTTSHAVVCGELACGPGCVCEDGDAGACGCGAP